MRPLAPGLLMAVLLPACETAEVRAPAGNNVCDSPTLEAHLPGVLDETSGVAASRTHAGVFWTHNDSGGDPVLFAVDSTGHVLARIAVAGAANRDWEDLALGPCAPGQGECLWLAETGDNNEHHPHAAVYRVPEPDPAADTITAPADIFRFSYPGGALDAEALFVTEAGVHVVSKGRSGAIDMFRLPPPYRSGGATAIHHVQRLAPPPTSVSAQVSAAASDSAGQRVVLRTYAGLRFLEVDGDTLRPVGRIATMVAPSQIKGEGVDFVRGNRLVLTSEAQGQRPPQIAFLACDPARPPADTL